MNNDNESNSNDIEQLFSNRNSNFSLVLDNFDLFKNIVNDLYLFFINEYNLTSHSKFKILFDKKISYYQKKIKMVIKKVFLVYVYQKLIKNNELENNSIFWTLIQKCPSRNISGVNSFAILLPPYPMKNDDDFNGCNHNCYYCPNQTKKNGADIDIARSYLYEEPAVQRGAQNGWDAMRQMVDRMNSLLMQGHEVDKLELIIEGGTYTEYPMSFLETFHRDLFYAANTFFDNNNNNNNNNGKREKYELKEEMNINITTKVRIIGICIETRPDAINNEWITFFRNSGTTRIQIGVQHNNDLILKKINRGHTFKDSCDAIENLKNNGFKIDIHLMPDLPYSNYELDKEMIDIIFKTSVLCPDQIKIYPCQITPYTVIKKWYEEGKYVPYSETNPGQLVKLIKYSFEICPPWIRFPRVVRDIPLPLIVGGNKVTNLRQVIDNELKKSNTKIMEIRSREIGRNLDYLKKWKWLKIRKYKSNNTSEYFISIESWDGNALYGFLRLRIPPPIYKYEPVFNILKNKGLVRELHVYNTLVPVGKNKNNSSQHQGIGKKLLFISEIISFLHNLNGVSVISGEGVRNYYKKQGYKNIDTYMIKNFKIKFNSILNAIFILNLILISIFIKNKYF